MSVTPTGMLSLPLANLRIAVSKSAAFQTWVGAANEAAALAFIGLIERTTTTGAFAVVDDGDAYETTRTESGGVSPFRNNGSLVLIFQGDVHADNQDDEVDAQLAFTNVVGAVMEELWTVCGVGSVFNLTGMSKMWGPARADDVERKGGADYMQIGFAVKWG